jgi:hypothetical protein
MDEPAEAQIAAMLPAEAEAVCLSLVHAVGWIREMLNAFTLDPLAEPRPRNAELDEKLLLRIGNLLDLQVIAPSPLVYRESDEYRFGCRR